MTVSPDAELDDSVDGCIYNRTVLVADAEVEEGDGLDYRYRERDEKQKECGDEGSKGRKKSGQHGKPQWWGYGYKGCLLGPLSTSALCSLHTGSRDAQLIRRE